MHRLRCSVSAVFAVLVGALVFSGCGGSDGSSDRAREGRRGGGSGATPTVEAVEARFGALPLQERMSGTVRAVNQVDIYPEIDAPVTRVQVESGDRVEAGQALVQLRDDAYRERLRQAEAEMKIAEAAAQRARADLRELRAQLNRTERLAEKQFQSQETLETLQARVQGAEADVAQADARVDQAAATVDERRADLRRTVVRAPIRGAVGNRSVEVGQRVSGSTRLFTIGNLDRVRVRVSVTDKMFGRIRAGQTARITAPSLSDTTITAAVSRISPFLNDDTYRAEAEIDVPNPGGRLTPGQFVKVDVLYGESESATLVPISAIYDDPSTGQQGVFVAPTLGQELPVDRPETYDADDPPPLTQPTPAVFRTVEVVAEGGQMAGIRGVEAGTWVVTVGQNLLDPRERVDARVRPMPWPRIMALQRLQSRDLLRQFMARQQRLGEERFGSRMDSTRVDS